jgi:hypothetical protein
VPACPRRHDPPFLTSPHPVPSHPIVSWQAPIAPTAARGNRG